jgi:hypothetical protein
MKTEFKKLPYGIANFKDLISGGYAYVDKTRFIEELEDEHGPYHFFIRPRKFGKSLFLSTLDYYYCRNQADKFQQLFGDLYIGKNPTKDRNTFAMLNFNFSGVDTSSEDTFRFSFLTTIEGCVCEFLDRYRNIFVDADGLMADAKGSRVGALSLAYRAANRANVRIFVIVDEYDHFANDLIAMGSRLSKDVYSRIVKANGLVRDFYERLKVGTSYAVSRIFITGISPIMLNDMSSGFNIAFNLTLEEQYNEMLGFTHKEVLQLMSETGVDPKFITVDLEYYYNGYKFNNRSENTVYNSNMVLFFFERVLRDKRPPEHLIDDNLRTDYSRVERLIENENNRTALLKIIRDGYIDADVVGQFSMDRMYREDYFASLLLYMGLLTFDGYFEGVMRLKIPNYSIQTLYWEYLADIIAADPDVNIDTTQQRDALKELAYRGNPRPFISYTSEHILKQFSNRDLIQFDEKYIKGVLLSGLLQSKIYFPTSEKEVTNGYIDIFLGRNPHIPDIKYEWVWELKYLKADDSSSLPAARDHALSQLAKYRASPLFSGRTDIKYAAIIFIGKQDYEIYDGG